jgi:teichuronic acid biosynthesis glycosyltransferase TuaC
MRILFLSKRQYMGKDLLDDRYGRFYELPEQLAALGHTVMGCCLAYHHREDKDTVSFMSTPTGVTWQAYALRPGGLPNLLRYHRDIQQLLGNFHPDVIVACSDAFHVVYAEWLGTRHHIPVVADLYDQFEAYGANRIPGLRILFRRALKRVGGVACVSEPLRRWTASLRGGDTHTLCLGNATDHHIFMVRDRLECRRRLGLPLDAKLIGTAGALTTDRDIETLYRAFATLAEQHPNLHLVVAGPRDIAPPAHDRVHDLGNLLHVEVPYFFSALDAGIVCNRDSLFAHYCHPQKMLEMQACGLPVIAAGVGILAGDQGLRGIVTYAPKNDVDLARKIKAVLAEARSGDDKAVPTWGGRAMELEKLLQEVSYPRQADANP